MRGFGWFGGCATVTLACYLVSLQVAAERQRLEQVTAKIAAAERDVRALETEFDTRANLVQLERWNGDTLALVAPTASQFVQSEAQLASISFDSATPQAGVRTAALVVPAFTTPVPVVAASAMQAGAKIVTAKLETAGAARATTQTAKAVAPSRRPAPVVVAAVAKPLQAPKASVLPAIVASIAKPAAARKPQAVAMLDRTLLSDSTFRDLVSGARGEVGRLR